MVQIDAEVSDEIVILERAAAKMREEMREAESEKRRDALLFLISDARKRVERLKLRQFSDPASRK